MSADVDIDRLAATVESLEAEVMILQRERDEATEGGIFWADRLAAAEAQRDTLAAELARIQTNAEDWHGAESEGTGAARALAVIAEWCRAALAAVTPTEEET